MNIFTLARQVSSIIICLVTVALVAPFNVYAQVACNSIVALDDAHIFSDASAITKAASGLIDQGADVHVVSTNSTGPLAQVETMMEASCPLWTATGKRKPNLFVVIVAPATHKKNAFFGGAYTPAMPTEDSVNLIYSQAANPYFKQGDFSGGVASALKDFSAKVAAYHDQQKHPVQQVVNNQATDLSGFWTFLYWTLGIVALVGIVWAISVWLASIRRRAEEVVDAQLSAVKARNRAVRMYQTISSATENQSQRFVDLSNTVKNDPSIDGLSAQQYNAIRDVWNDFYSDISPKSEVNEPYQTRHSKWKSIKSHRDSYPVQTTAPTPASTVVVNQSSGGNDFLTGMLVGEELERPREVYVEPTYRESESRYEPPSYDPPASSGSDSSWSSSSSSDDSYSSGSDSSYSDSSSSDSGGGSDSSW